MKRFLHQFRSGVLLFVASLALTGVRAQSQLPECESTVPFRIVDLSNDPDGTHYTDSIERLGNCTCNTQNNQNFVSFYVTLNPNVASLEIGIVGGADPSGSGTYWVIEDLDGNFATPGTCTQETSGGQFMCITGAGPHKIVYKKPGSNLVQYYIHQIPQPMFPASGVARVGCTIPFPIYGLDNVVITPLSNTGGFSTTQCSNMVVYDPTVGNYEFGAFPKISPGNYPYTVTYKICGDQQASTTCGTYDECDTVTMTVYPPLNVTLPTSATYCEGGPGVTLNPTLTGGFGPFTYTWTKDGVYYANTSSITVSDTADYAVTVRDSITSFNASCVGIAEVQVLIGNDGYINAGADQFVCESDPTVYLTGMVQHTTGAYWTSNGTGTFQDTTIMFGGYQSDTVTTTATYTPSAHDMNTLDQVQIILHKVVPGCGLSTDTMYVRFIEPVNTIPTAAPILCNGGTTTVNVTATGDPLSTFSYYWSNGGSGTSQILPSGTYSITAVDQYGCGDNTPITIANPSQITLTMSSTNTSTDIACDGNATVAISGGTSPYSVLWSNGQTTNTTTSTLCYGIYTVTVTDANGCQTVSSVVVNKPSCSSFNVIANSTNVSCYGGADGTATSNVTGGTPGYTYLWSPFGGSTASATGLTSGTYTVTVTDGGGCMDVANVTILQPSAITNTMTHTDVTSIGGSDGTATANPLGGTPFIPSNYTYTWSTTPVQSTQTATALTSDTNGVMYYVTIQDSLLCSKVDSVLINQPPCNNFTLAVNTTNILCYGNSTGKAKLLIAHGTAPYTITWSGGTVAPDQMSVSNLSAGTYTVTVTDASGCTTFTNFTITQPNQLSVSLVPTNVTCNGLAIPDGTIDATVYGGTQPYQYAWSGGTSASTQDLYFLETGFYFLTVTDNNKCIVNGGASISTPSALGVTVVSSVDVTCFDADNGSINITPTGGVGPYTYDWTSNDPLFTSSSQDLSNLPSSNYYLVLTDANGCTYSDYSDYINQPDSMAAIAVVLDSVSCAGAQDGSLELTINGGNQGATVPALIYAWTGPSGYSGTTQDISGLKAGSYSVTVTDGKGCTATTTIVMPTIADTTDPVITCPGNKAVTTTTACTYVHSDNTWNATASDNCVVNSIAYALTGVTTGTGTTMNGVSFNLGVTTVTWTATDGSGNTASCSYTVTVNDTQAPTGLTCSTVGNQTAPANAGVCTYTHSGTAWNVTASDNCSIASVTYLLSGATTTTIPASTLNGQVFNLGLTTVTWTATDGSGNTTSCSYTVTVTDTQAPTGLTCSSVGNQTVVANTGVCTYTHSGTAWNVTASDNCSIASVTYLLSGATNTTIPASNMNGQVFNLGLTTVTWTARDGSGNSTTCSYNVTVTDTQDPSILSCGVTTSITVNANGGVCTYTNQGTTWNASGADNCSTVTMSYVLTGATTGSGTSLAGQIFNLDTTTVTWTATDGSGNTETCSFDVIVVDNQLPIILTCGPNLDQNVFADASQCNYTQTGTAWNATATDNCSVASLVYTLSGATTGTGTSLQNVDFNLGITTVTWTATDGSGNIRTCSFLVTVRDNQFPAISTCGANDQTVSANTGVCTYTQTSDVWNAIATDNCTVSSLVYTLSGASAGTGTTLNGVTFNLGETVVLWTATDNSGNVTTCSYTINVIDDQDPGIANCPSDITVGVDAGDCGAVVNWTVPTFSDNCVYTFDASHDPGDFFNVGTTTVTYTVTDGSGNISICTFDVTVDDDELPSISCAANIASCNPFVTYSAPVVGDNCAIQAVIQTAGLPSGINYPVGTTTNAFQVTDIHGNVATCSFTVTIHPLPVATTTDVDVTCNGNDDGTINLTVTSGTPTFTYDWDNGATSEDLSGLAPGTYTVQVFDNFGCTATASATITEPAVLTLTAEDDHVNCYNGNDGAIDLTIAGGATPYTYDWSNNATTQDITGLTDGSYDVTVTDFNGCTVTYSTVIDEPDTLVIQTAIYDATCNAPNGSIQTLITGGTTPYITSWSNGSNTANLNNVSAGTYTLTVIDAQGCTSQFSGSVAGVSNLTASSIVRDARCYGQANGEIQVIMESGNEPYVFDWSNGASTALNDHLAEGSYTVTVTDAFGCEVTMNFDVNQPDSLEVTLTTSAFIAGTNVSVNGASDGWITTDVIGGTPAHSYEWSNGETTEDIYNLPAGAYSVVVIDQNGCKASAAVRFTEPLPLEMPEGFSPNGDGSNDGFVIHGIEAYPNNDLVIYNRWGNVVYEVSGYQNEWMGENTAGEALPDGTYFAILKVYASEERVITLKGYVDLRR